MYRCIRPFIVFLSLCFILFLSSCKSDFGNNTDGFSLTPNKIFSFNLPFPVNGRYTEVFNDKNGETIFCSYNAKTYKKIELFSLNGKIIKSISLNNILANGDQIDDVVPISTDSFWVLSAYSNNLYLLGAEGNILSQIKINASLVDTLRTETRGSIFSNFCISNNTFLFNCVYYYKNESQRYTLSDYFRTNKAQPYFLKMQSPFDSVPKMTFGLPGFYNRIFKSADAISVEGALYIPTPKGILLTSWYTDSLYLINENDFSIKDAVRMVSKYSTIGCTPLTAAEFQQGVDLNARLRHSGGVLGMYYDSFRDLIYIVLREEAAKNTAGPNNRKSLLVFDSSLHLKDEIKLDCNKYDLSEMYVLKEGLLINKLDKNHGSDSKFQLFYVDEK